MIYKKILVIMLASLPACQLASLPACQLASLPACQLIIICS
ncbi:hypothetical protein [Moraxella lacunata]